MANKALKSLKFPGLPDTYTIPQVDATLETAGAAADAKKVGDELTDVKADLSEVIPHHFDDFPVNKGYIEGGTWRGVGTGTNFYTIIPVLPGDKVYIKSGSDQDARVIALKSYTDPPVQGTAPDWATGWSSFVDVAINTAAEFTMPADASYVYLFLGTSAAHKRKPVEFAINGFDYILPVYKQIGTERFRTDNIEKMAPVNENIRTFDSYGKHLGYLNNGVWVTNVNYYAIIPVNGGETIEIIAPTASGNDVWYAALKTYTEPTAGDTPDYSDSDGWGVTRKVSTGNGFVGVLPSDARYVYFYLGGSASPRKPIKLALDGYDIIPTFLRNVTEKVPTKSAVVSVKFMQWNIGAFDYGRKASSGNPQGMTEEQYQEKLPKYRQFFCDYRPDILCMQEYLQYMDKLHAHPTDEVLFDALYPNTARSGPLCIKTIYPIISYEVGNLTSTEGYACPYVLAVLDIYGKKVAVITTALYYAQSPEAYSARTQEFTALLEVASPYDYAVICADVNCSGNSSDVTSQIEAAERVAYAESVGFETCNGAYLGWHMTHYDEDYGLRPLDNIIYKVTNESFRDFDVLSDEYDNVSSDHYALISELALR